MKTYYFYRNENYTTKFDMGHQLTDKINIKTMNLIKVMYSHRTVFKHQ